MSSVVNGAALSVTSSGGAASSVTSSGGAALPDDIQLCVDLLCQVTSNDCGAELHCQ